MKHVFNFCLFGLFNLLPVIAYCQEVVAPAGHYFENAQGSISWTIGETVIMTHIHSQYQLTQGFQQNFYWSSTSIGIDLSLNDIFVYPNPTRDIVFISTSHQNPDLMRFEIFDMRGNLVFQDRMLEPETQVEMRYLHPGSYFIRIIRDPFLLKTINVIKY